MFDDASLDLPAPSCSTTIAATHARLPRLRLHSFEGPRRACAKPPGRRAAGRRRSRPAIALRWSSSAALEQLGTELHLHDTYFAVGPLHAAGTALTVTFLRSAHVVQRARLEAARVPFVARRRAVDVRRIAAVTWPCCCWARRHAPAVLDVPRAVRAHAAARSPWQGAERRRVPRAGGAAAPRSASDLARGRARETRTARAPPSSGVMILAHARLQPALQPWAATSPAPALPCDPRRHLRPRLCRIDTTLSSPCFDAKRSSSSWRKVRQMASSSSGVSGSPSAASSAHQLGRAQRMRLVGPLRGAIFSASSACMRARPLRHCL